MKSKKVMSMKEARLAAGLTLEQVAAAAGISYSAVRALEIGIGKNYSVAIKHSVSSVLGVPFFSIFPEEWEKLGGLMEELKVKKPRA